jgi:hypothetical protein
VKAYIYEAYVPAGGTYMAYHVGRILQQRFGFEAIAVGTPPRAGLFSYPLALPCIDEATFQGQVAETDLLVCNPSFSVQQFGLRLPCRKLCYVQNIRTFAVLDVFFDHYVFVSDWVRRFITPYYGIHGNVVPAFIHTEAFHPAGVPWAARRPVFQVLQRKHDERIFDRLLETYRQRYPEHPLCYEIVPLVPQPELARRLRDARYFLSMDAMEGFGLPMLEAMACGCAVAGWDSGGCRQFAEPGRNALLARYGDLQALADAIHLLATQDAMSEALGTAGAATAPEFSLERFEARWATELEAFLSIRGGAV